MARTASKCVYNHKKRLQRAGTYPSHRADGRPPRRPPRGLGPPEIPAIAPSHSLSDGVFASVPSPAKSDRIPSTSSDAMWAATNEPAVGQVFGTDEPPHGELVLACRDPLEQRFSLGTSPSIFTVPPFFLPTIPPEPWIPLSFLGEERVQVQFSEAAATDLDMKWCVVE